MNKILKIISAVFLAVFLISLTSAVCESGCSINTYLEFEDTATNSKTVTQGDSVEFLMTAYSYGQAFQSEKLVLLPSSLKVNDAASGTELNSGTFLYTNTYSLDTTSLIAGTHTLRFIAHNGYEIEYSELTLIVEEIPDTTPPSLDVNYPVDGVTYDSHRTELIYHVYDENLNSCAYKLNDESWVHNSDIENGEVKVEGITSVEGENTWIVSCSDDSWNSNEDSTTFYVKLPDTEKPKVEITFPNEGTTYTSHRTFMNFDVEEENLDYCEYKLNSEPWKTVLAAAEGSNKIKYITSIEGSNTWSVRCFDESNNEATDSVTFIIKLPDTTKPNIEIQYPVDGMTYSSHRTELTFDVTEENLNFCTYKLNNGPQIDIPSASNGVNTVSGITSIEGENTWYVTCEDDAGNSEEDSVTFIVEIQTVDDIDPVVEIIYPEDGKTYNAHLSLFRFTLVEENPDKCRYVLNGAQSWLGDCIEGLTEVHSISTIEGINTLEVFATDKSGNIGSDSVFFIVDTTVIDDIDPVVEIKYPVDGMTYNTHVDTLMFDVIEENLDYCEYKINSNPEIVIANPTNSNQILNLLSQEGENTWSVTCYDKSGNTGSDSVTFIVDLESEDTTPPIVEIVYPVDGATYEEERTFSSFNVIEENLDKCWYVLEDEAPVNFSCNEGSNILRDLTSEEGENTWKIYAIDFSGNIGFDTVTFTIEEDDDDCEEECDDCNNDRKDNKRPKEVISSDPAPTKPFINKPIILEHEEEQAKITITFGEKMFYGIIVMVLLMMIMATLMLILEQRRK